MKQLILLITFLLITLFGFSQNIRTDKYEVYLNTIIANEVSVAKSMYMTSKKQYFYEGEIEANIIDTNETQMYKFYFTAWDDSYKEFLVKDDNYNAISPEITFTDKETAVIAGSEYKLHDSSSVDHAILSSMLIWLDNQSGQNKTTSQPEVNEATEEKNLEIKLEGDKPVINKPEVDSIIEEKNLEIKLEGEKPVINKSEVDKPVIDSVVKEKHIEIKLEGDKPVLNKELIEKSVKEKPAVEKPVKIEK